MRLLRRFVTHIDAGISQNGMRSGETDKCLQRLELNGGLVLVLVWSDLEPGPEPQARGVRGACMLPLRGGVAVGVPVPVVLPARLLVRSRTHALAHRASRSTIPGAAHRRRRQRAAALSAPLRALCQSQHYRR